MHSDEVCTCFCFTFCVKLKKCLSIRSFKVNLRNPVNQEPEVVWGEVTGHVESLKRFERERDKKKIRFFLALHHPASPQFET